MTADVIKKMDKNAEWLWQITTKIWSETKIPKDLKRNIMVPIYKQKEKVDVLQCKNYGGIKLLEHVLKIIESILEKRLRKYIKIDQMQFGYRPGRGTVDAIFILRHVQDNMLDGNRSQNWAFVDLEKAFDRAPKELIYWSLRKKEVPEECISMVKAMYEDATTVFKCKDVSSESFEVKVGMHQGLKLSPLVFVTVLNALSKEVKRGLPWKSLSCWRRPK